MISRSGMIAPVAIAINPSILNADLADLASEIARIPSADAVHLDVMDNHFVPNLTFGLPFVESLRKHVAKAMDVHLMISEADHWAPQYAEIGCESVTFHVEAAKDPAKIARELRRLGSKAALALKPATPIDPYVELLDSFDQILIMTVEPGFGGQKFLDSCLPKIRQLRELVTNSDLRIAIGVDGGINAESIEKCAAAGADVFVAGSAVYEANDPNLIVQELRSLAVASQ